MRSHLRVSVNEHRILRSVLHHFPVLQGPREITVREEMKERRKERERERERKTE